VSGVKKGRASFSGALSLFIAGMVAVYGIVWGLTPAYFLEVRLAEGPVLYRVKAQPGTVFAYHYRHSVEKTAVYERYRVTGDHRIVLYETEASSLGAGLPYGADGRFTTGNGTFILTGLDKPVDVLRLKPTALSPCALVFENYRLDLDRPELDGRSVEVQMIKTTRFSSRGWTDGARS
jgi:hypothetical protein